MSGIPFAVDYCCLDQIVATFYSQFPTHPTVSRFIAGYIAFMHGNLFFVSFLKVFQLFACLYRKWDDAENL
jgi:hypothetical protein